MNILHTIRLPRPAWRLASLFALMLTALILLPAVAQAQSPPRTPGVITVSRSDGALHAFWNSGGGATSYHITYTSDNGKSWQLAALNHPAGNGTTSIDITGVDNSKPYIVGVRARNSAGDSAWRNSSSIGRYEPPPQSPAAPTGLSATGSDKSVTLSWNKPTGDVTGYQFRLREYPGPGWGKWYSVPDGDRNTTYYTIHGLKNGTEYRFKLRAVNSGAVSIPAPTSDPWYVSATPKADIQPPPPPSAPLAPASVSVYRHDGKLVVYWDASDDADNYDVRYSSDGGKNWLIAAWYVSTLGTVINGVSNDDAYIVGVRARNHIGESAWTNSDTVPPSTPYLSTTNVSTTTATLNISNHDAEWHYKANKGPDSTCQSVAAGTSSDNLTALTATTTYTYTAYSDNGCSSELGAAHWFVTRLSASNITNSPQTLDTHCVASNRNCAMGFTTGASSGGYTLESATLKLWKNDPNGALGNIRVTLHAAMGSWSGDNKVPANTALATLSGSNPTGTYYTPSDYTYTCSGCALNPNTTYFIQANADAGRYNNEYYLWKGTNQSSDTLVPSGNGWTLLDELDWGNDGNRGWQVNNIYLGLFELEAKPEPALDASSVTTISATLTLSHYGGAWWLKRTTPADTTCMSKGTTATESLGSLTSGTSYTYKAYSKDGCESADEIATATFSTPSS